MYIMPLQFRFLQEISSIVNCAYSKVPPVRNSILRNSGLIFQKKYPLLLEIQQADLGKVSYMIQSKI